MAAQARDGHPHTQQANYEQSTWNEAPKLRSWVSAHVNAFLNILDTPIPKTGWCLWCVMIRRTLLVQHLVGTSHKSQPLHHVPNTSKQTEDFCRKEYHWIAPGSVLWMYWMLSTSASKTRCDSHLHVWKTYGSWHCIHVVCVHCIKYFIVGKLALM